MIRFKLGLWNPNKEERKRPGQDEVMLTKSIEGHHENNNLVYRNEMHYNLYGRRQVQESWLKPPLPGGVSYLAGSHAQVPSPEPKTKVRTKRTPWEGGSTWYKFFEGGSLPLGSWLVGDPPGGGFLRSKLQSYSHFRVIPGHRNWQIENAVWNLASFLLCALETRWQRFGQFLNDFLNDLLYKNLNFL